MPHFSRDTGKARGTVTVIETRMHQAWARKARIAFWVVALATAFVAASIASTFTASAMVSGLIGIIVGLSAGAVAFAAVRAWPYARMVWWWSGELVVLLAAYAAWSAITLLPLAIRFVVMASLLVVMLVPAIRRRTVAVTWCFVVRHRLRTCFAQFIIANRSGLLPLILVARPTPVGERVWIYLRPGLSLNDLANRIDKIAVACHAASVVVDRASDRTAAFVRVDIKRREVLGATIGSPLADLTEPEPCAVDPSSEAALDLPDIPVSPAAPSRPSAPVPTPTSAGPPIRPVFKVPGTAEDLADWID